MHTAESRVTGPERKGFWRELGDELLDKEDLEHERRFDMRSLPLILLALVAGVVWSRTRQEWAMAVGACALAAYGAYFLWNRAVYVVRLLRGRNVLEKSAKPRRSARVDTALVRRLTRLADDDRLYALVGAYGVPILGNLMVLVYGLTSWTWALWALVALAVVYGLYWLTVVFAKANRHLVSMVGERDARLREAGRRMAIMRRDNELASRTHDTVTGGLSYIAFTAQQRMEDDAAAPADREAWQKVEAMAQRTLDNVHAVIDILGATTDAQRESEEPAADSGAGDGRVSGAAFTRLITERLAEGDARLADLGFHGTSRLADTLPAVRRDVARECLGLVEELATNIASHATAGGAYALLVALQDGDIAITQTNDATACPGAVNRRRPASGRGLDAHRRAIQRLGGTLRTSCEEGQWMLHVAIPAGEVPEGVAPATEA